MDKADYFYDMQIKINIIFNDYFFKEDSLVSTLFINFTDEFKSKEEENSTEDSENNPHNPKDTNYPDKSNYFLFLILFIIIIIAIIALLAFLFYNFKLKKKNENLENKVLSISLTSINDKQLFNEYSEKLFYF